MKNNLFNNFLTLTLLLFLACNEEPTTPTKFGSLIINSEPKGASIFLNGEATNLRTPDTLKGLYSGKHDIKLTYPGRKDTLFSIQLESNQLKEIFIQLKDYSNEGWTTYDIFGSNTLENFIEVIKIDNQSNVWVGIDRSGIAKFTGSNWIHYNTSNSSIPFNSVSWFDFDSNGNLWISFYEEPFISKFDGSNFSKIALPDLSPFRGWAHWITVDKSNNIWVNYFAGLYRLKDNIWYRHFSANPLLSTGLSNLRCDTYNNIWFILDNCGFRTLHKFDGSKISTIEVPYAFYGPNTFHLEGDNTIFMTTLHGSNLLKMKDSVFTNYEIQINENKDCIFTDSKGNIWFGTRRSGLFKFDGFNLKNFNSSNSGLISNWIFRITIDKNDNKWIGTDRGLVKYSGE